MGLPQSSLELGGVNLGFFDLLIHLGHSRRLTFGFRGGRDLQGLGRRHRGFGVEQVEVPEGVHDFLVGGFFKCAGGVRSLGSPVEFT